MQTSTTNSDEALVRECLRRVEGIDNVSEKARRLGVHETTVRRWLRGDISTPLRVTRPSLEHFLQTHDEEGRSITSAPGRVVQEESQIYPAPPLLREVHRLLVSLGEPGEAQGAKQEVMQAYRALLKAADEAPPEWFYRLLESVDRGEV